MLQAQPQGENCSEISGFDGTAAAYLVPRKNSVVNDAPKRQAKPAPIIMPSNDAIGSTRSASRFNAFMA